MRHDGAQPLDQPAGAAAGRGPGDYSRGEEVAHSVTHGVGAALAIAALTVLVALAAVRGDARHVVAASIFGATLVLLYTASTLYHAIPLPAARGVLQGLDHAAIFLLIAGTYTPFTLITLRGPWGWSLFGVVWGSAVLGITARAVLGTRFAMLRVIVYVVMGWSVVVAAGPLVHRLPTGGLVLLVLGGLAYTLGLAFYGWHRLRYHHAVWHLFVLAGSALHYFAVLLYVIPDGTGGR